MKYRLQYQTEVEKEMLISNHPDKTLIEEQNLTDGNFLIFSDDPENDTKIITYMNVPQEVYEAQSEQIIELEANFMYDSMMKELAIEDLTEQHANLIYQLMMSEVL